MMQVVHLKLIENFQGINGTQKVDFLTSKYDLNLMKELVDFYIWSRALYGAET
jgi:hypothetical protein